MDVKMMMMMNAYPSSVLAEPGEKNLTTSGFLRILLGNLRMC